MMIALGVAQIATNFPRGRWSWTCR